MTAAVYGFLPCWAALLRHGENLNEFILYVLGGKIFSPLNNPPVLLFAFIPTVLLLFLFSDFISGDFEAMAVYILTRTPRPMRCFGPKLLYLAGCIALYSVLGAAASLCAGLASGASPEGFNWRMFTVEVILFFLNNLMLVGLVSISALKTGSFYAFLAVAALHVISILAAAFSSGFLKELFCYANPFCQGVYAWHDEASAGFYEPHGKTVFPPAFYSAVYLLLVAGVEYLALRHYLKRADFF